jgi:hypothetical protein
MFDNADWRAAAVYSFITARAGDDVPNVLMLFIVNR